MSVEEWKELELELGVPGRRRIIFLLLLSDSDKIPDGK